MKFSHSLQFNAVPEWSQYYVAYPILKKKIYQIERDMLQEEERNGVEGARMAPLLDMSSRAVSVFIPMLDHELGKVVDFYQNKEEELVSELRELQAEADSIGIPSMATLAERGRARKSSVIQRASFYEEDVGHSLLDSLPAITENDLDESEGMDATVRARASSMDSIRALFPSVDVETRISLRKEVQDLYVRLCDIREYVNINQTAFGKILKKFDKVTRNRIRPAYINEAVRQAYPFQEATRHKLQAYIKEAEELHGRVSGIVNPRVNARELKTFLRKSVEFERNTVWRDMIGLERKHSALNLRSPSPAESEEEVVLPETLGDGRRNALKYQKKQARARIFGYILPRWFSSAFVWLMISICVFFFIASATNVFPVRTERYCAALLVFVSMLWATEVMPLFATSLLVPFLVVVLGVLRDPITELPMPANFAAKRIFAAMFSPAIMLLLGGFAIAAALSKHMVAKEIAARVLNLAGTDPRQLLLATMLVATVLSMWISNVAAPVLCFSLIHPILRTLPPGSPFARCLIIGIALASNIGGMASPIASPQNLIAMAIMNPPPSWIEWFAIALPLCILCDVATWALLIWHYRPPRHAAIHPIRPGTDPIRGVQVYVIAVTLFTVALWCLESNIHAIVGDMAVIAIIPLVAFFGTGVLSKEDFNNFLWTVIILAQGGIALGEAVSSSGLLHRVALLFQSTVAHHDLWTVLFIVCGFVLVVATFISHTVSAVILLPIVDELGKMLPIPHPRLLVMGTVIMCSGAMGLPISGFPNMNAIMLEDSAGVRYLRTMDFIQTGVPASVIVYLMVVSVGYAIMRFVVGF